jgi:hypothetical protein
MAETRQVEANADISEANARKAHAEADVRELQVRHQKCDLILDYAVAVDSLVSALRNAGVEHTQIQRVVRDRLTADIDILARHKSLDLADGENLSVIPGL